MAMIKCPECSKKVSSSASTCPYCGLANPSGAAQAKEQERIEDLKKIFCPYCKQRIYKGSSSCDFCKQEIPYEVMQQIIKKDNATRTAVGVGCVSIIIIVVIFMFRACDFSSDPAPSGPHKIVENSTWDGSVRQVKDYLRLNLKDPGSVEYIEWGNVVEQEDGFIVRVKYRAKNSFGGYVIEEKRFKLDRSGTVQYSLDN